MGFLFFHRVAFICKSATFSSYPPIFLSFLPILSMSFDFGYDISFYECKTKRNCPVIYFRLNVSCFISAISPEVWVVSFVPLRLFTIYISNYWLIIDFDGFEKNVLVYCKVLLFHLLILNWLVLKFLFNILISLLFPFMFILKTLLFILFSLYSLPLLFWPCSVIIRIFLWYSLYSYFKMFLI